MNDAWDLIVPTADVPNPNDPKGPSVISRLPVEPGLDKSAEQARSEASSGAQGCLS
jgi:hypothetical protein